MNLLTTGEILKKIRHDGSLVLPLYDSEGLSAFLPRRFGDQVCEVAFVYSLAPIGRPEPLTGRPYAWLGVMPSTAQVLFYNLCAWNDFMPKDAPPHGQISLALPQKRSVAEFLTLNRAFIEAYEALRPFALLPHAELDDSVRAAMQRYRELFGCVIAPDLAPYYRALSPEFFTWIGL